MPGITVLLVNQTVQQAAAEELLHGDPSRPERDVETGIIRLLAALGVDEIKQDHARDSGRADIYLPRRRVFIEVKRAGGVDDPQASRSGADSPFEQVQRYVRAEICYEIARTSEQAHDRSWLGLVTDGRVWHAWEFQHELASRQPAAVLKDFRPQDASELLLGVAPLLTVEPVGKPRIPVDPVDVFKHHQTKLEAIYSQVVGSGSSQRIRLATETKHRLWVDMLRGSGMTPAAANETRLFVAHSFLVALARGVEHTLTNPDIPPDPQKLVGNGFLGWIIESPTGEAWAQELLDQVHGYEWRLTPGDVLRPLYEQFVDKSDRKDFGEVYTPDWLAEMMAAEVLDDDWCHRSVQAALSHLRDREPPEGVGVLDPTCGSGTFLYHSAQRLLSSAAMQGLNAAKQAEVVCLLVNGIDIHPVAVEFSRATLLRALPAAPAAAERALRIYQGDSLMLRQTDTGTLFEPQNGEILIRSPQQREIRIPRAFAEHKDFQDMLARGVEAAASGNSLPLDIAGELPDELASIEACHEALTTVIAEEGNSVWAWFITNVIGADQLSRRKVDRIVANPPWVNLADIRGDRKKVLEAAAGKDNRTESLGLWTGGNQAPHFDIAQLFICHARTNYLADPDGDPAAWVTKASAIRGGNWKRFRDWHEPYLAQALDFSQAQVFGGGDARRSCVLYEIRKPSVLPAPQSPHLSSAAAGSAVLEMSCPAEKPEVYMAWAEARKCLRWQPEISFPREDSSYKSDTWRQGATITPKVLTITETPSAAAQHGRTEVTTLPSSWEPWKALPSQTGEIPDDWLLPLMQSQQLRPFSVSASPHHAIVPCDPNGGLLAAEQARKEPFWVQLEDLYEDGRGEGSNTPKTLIAQINYNNKLSAQLPLQSASRIWMVLYPGSGDIMRAARIKAQTMIIDSSIFRRKVASAAEAQYLLALLNAPCLKKAFKKSRTSGRHFQTNPWRAVPIPAYDPTNPVHIRLAALAAQSERAVTQLGIPAETGQVAASKKIREHLAETGVLPQIDQQVKLILPNHTT